MDAAPGLPAEVDQEADRRDLERLGPRGQPGRVALGVAGSIPGRRAGRSRHGRAGAGPAGPGSASRPEVGFADVGELVDPRVAQERLEPDDPGVGQRLDLVGVARDQAAEEPAVHPELPPGGVPLGGQRRGVVVTGLLLSGMSTSVVIPPAAAAAVAVGNPSQSARPGSLMWTWVSTRPGRIIRSPRSSTRIDGSTSPGSDDADDLPIPDQDRRGADAGRGDDAAAPDGPACGLHAARLAWIGL